MEWGYPRIGICRQSCSGCHPQGAILTHWTLNTQYEQNGSDYPKGLIITIIMNEVIKILKRFNKTRNFIIILLQN